MMNRTLFHQLIRVRTFTNRLSPMVSVVFTILCFASTLSIAQPNRTVDSMESSPRVGTNLSGITDWSSSFPFVDLFKSSRNWISGNTDGRWSDGRTVAMDEHGWVTSLLPNQIARGILLADEMPLFMSGTFLVLYEGNGTIVYQGSARLIPGESQPGRHVIQIDAQAGNTWLEILQTDASNYIRNIQIVRPEYEHNAKSVIFNPDFIASLQNMKALRFMDWARTNSSTLTQWADRPKVADARWSSDFGVPLEIMILLANRIDADPWFCIPHLANDRYVKLAAAMVDDQVEPGRTLYVEHSNEVWNSIFPQAIYARQQGIARGYSDDEWQAGWFYHSVRSVEIFRIWKNRIQQSGNEHRLIRVMGGFNTVAWGSEQALQFRDAYLDTDALAVGPYFGGSLGSDDRGEQIRQLSVDELLDLMEQESIPEALLGATANGLIATQYGTDLIAYEGGQHLAAWGKWQSDQTINALFDAANRHPRMGLLYDQFFGGWEDAGGSDWLNFIHCGRYSPWGRFGVLEYITQPQDESPKYQAVQRFATKSEKSRR